MITIYFQGTTVTIFTRFNCPVSRYRCHCGLVLNKQCITPPRTVSPTLENTRSLMLLIPCSWLLKRIRRQPVDGRASGAECYDEQQLRPLHIVTGNLTWWQDLEMPLSGRDGSVNPAHCHRPPFPPLNGGQSWCHSKRSHVFICQSDVSELHCHRAYNRILDFSWPKPYMKCLKYTTNLADWKPEPIYARFLVTLLGS
jgi:hypothetical protein